VPGVAAHERPDRLVNAICGNLTAQVRISPTSPRRSPRGDLSRKITVDVRGGNSGAQGHHQHDGRSAQPFASEVTRVAREVGTEGKLRRTSPGPGVAGTWKDSPTTSLHGVKPHRPGPHIADVATAIAGGDLPRKKSRSTFRAEILQLKETLNTMVDQLNAFAGEVTRVAREVRHRRPVGRQANVLGVAGTWKDLTESVNSMASNLTAQVRTIAK